jgi:hypothetical protein
LDVSVHEAVDGDGLGRAVARSFIAEPRGGCGGRYTVARHVAVVVALRPRSVERELGGR